MINFKRFNFHITKKPDLLFNTQRSTLNILRTLCKATRFLSIFPEPFHCSVAILDRKTKQTKSPEKGILFV